MGDEAESSSPDPRDQGLTDAASGRNEPNFHLADDWSDEDWNAYLDGFREQHQRMQPARAPAAWPVALVLIAADAAVWAATVRSSWRQQPLLLACHWGLDELRKGAEKRRARGLGLESAAEQPRALRRITVPPLGRTVPVSIVLPTRTFVPSMVAAFAIGMGRRLRERRQGRRQEEIPQSWELHLADRLTTEILRRRDWRRAGGPTRPRTQ
ncbi:MAG: hypothetical protein QOD76_442 [Solirubrobacteraceae bacterium]|nr:hypothetical protein [Solirubrobacteraceae bacterium]